MTSISTGRPSVLDDDEYSKPFLKRVSKSSTSSASTSSYQDARRGSNRYISPKETYRTVSHADPYAFTPPVETPTKVVTDPVNRPRISITVSTNDLGEGCYLQYGPVGHGTLSAVWSKQVPKAPAIPPVNIPGKKTAAMAGDLGQLLLAFLQPAKPVPAFKYKGASRRQDLVKGIASSKSNYCRGWISFVKIARTHEGRIMFLDGINDVPPVKIYLMDSGNRLRTLRYNVWEEVCDAKAVAVIPGGSTIFDGVNVMDPTVLIQKANETGGAAAFV
eukprot:Blabericola_migrator_1__2833@NODE_180_length_11882_cov_134_948540_g18_i1_p5_GENE_NODE_180_length_11882_cov_134_948540_g18_i1NODE_180_length_11882_cov_134_948540_g18_i1_p5_ORF_typecomplete_len275_score31_12IMP2_N/PF18590_1/1_6e16IMP2_C/PF18591_1/0_0003KAR9/PF08580_10/1_4_NODE_180_length_11882_cov_134_948540_g18_i11051511339